MTDLTADLSRSESLQVKTVLGFTEQHLGSIVRRSGESYADHGKEVAELIAESGSGATLRSIALLHDLLVHPRGHTLLRLSPLSLPEQKTVELMFGLRRLHIDEKTKDLDTVIESFSADPLLLPLRMAHRLNDVRHIDRFSKKLQRAMAKETLHMYTAIASRLGMYAWRYEMEDRCFAFLHPKIYKQLSEQFALCRQIDESCMKQAKRFLLQKLQKEGIDARIDARRKALFSAYRKMALKKRRFEDLTDRIALRITVANTEDCYRALGVVHMHMHPIAGKLKDYIGAPKENGYRSIHTVVYPLPGVTEQPIEIQIRTDDMHREAQFGFSSHSDYKAMMYGLQTNASRVFLLQHLRSLRSYTESPRKFSNALRRYFRDDHVVVFDANNTLYHLPQSATALDFVYAAFPTRAARLKAVRVNGRTRRPDLELQSGDIVEPQFGRTKTIQKQWLKECRLPVSKKWIRSELS